MLRDIGRLGPAALGTSLHLREQLADGILRYSDNGYYSTLHSKAQPLRPYDKSLHTLDTCRTYVSMVFGTCTGMCEKACVCV